MEKYRSVKITGINGFELFVGFESVWHDWAIDAKSLGVKVEIIYTNKHYSKLADYCIRDNLDDLVIYDGSINREKLANRDQIWYLDDVIRQKIKNPIMKKECFPELSA